MDYDMTLDESVTMLPLEEDVQSYTRPCWLRAVRYAMLSAQHDASNVSQSSQRNRNKNNNVLSNTQQQQTGSMVNSTAQHTDRKSQRTTTRVNSKTHQSSFYACDICQRDIGACECFDYYAGSNCGGGLAVNMTPDACLDRNASFVFQFGVISHWPPSMIPPVDTPPVFQMIQDTLAASIWYLEPAIGATMAQVEQRFGFDVYVAQQQGGACVSNSRANAALALTATSAADLAAEQAQILIGTLVHITGFAPVLPPPNAIVDGIYIIVNVPSSVEQRYTLRRVNMFGNFGGLTGIFNVANPNPDMENCCEDRWMGDWCCRVMPNVGDNAVYENLNSRFPITSVDPLTYNFDIDENSRGDVWQLIDVKYAITCSY